LDHIEKGNLHSLATKDFKDIVVSLSAVVFEPNHFTNRILEPNQPKLESET